MTVVMRIVFAIRVTLILVTTVIMVTMGIIIEICMLTFSVIVTMPTSALLNTPAETYPDLFKENGRHSQALSGFHICLRERNLKLAKTSPKPLNPKPQQSQKRMVPATINAAKQAGRGFRFGITRAIV